jgi:hypothetical protein
LSSSQASVDRNTVTDGQKRTPLDYKVSVRVVKKKGQCARTMCVRDQEAERRPTLLNAQMPEGAMQCKYSLRSKLQLSRFDLFDLSILICIYIYYYYI